MPKHPVGHVAAVRATADAHAIGVDEAGALDQLVQRAHQVGIVLASPIAHALSPETLAVPIRSAWVDAQNDVTHAGEDLQLVEEGPTVLSVRAAVDLHDERIHLARVKTFGLGLPTLDDPSVWRGERSWVGVG